MIKEIKKRMFGEELSDLTFWLYAPFFFLSTYFNLFYLKFRRFIGKAKDNINISHLLFLKNPIQEAISLLNPGGEVFIPAGTWSIAADITFVNKLSLVGSGWATILQAATGVTYMFKPAGLDALWESDGTGDDEIIIKNIKFDSNDIAHSILYFPAHDPLSYDNLLVEGCYFYNPTIAQKGNIQLFGNNRIFTNNFVENCWIINMGFGNFQIFSNNYVKNTNDSCISMGSSYDNNYYNWVISDNVLEKVSEENSGYNIDVYGAMTDVVISNNVCVGANLENIYVHGGSKSGGGYLYPGPRISVIGNVCRDAGRNGISITSSFGQFLVSNNQVENPVGNGISMSADKAIVSNNLVVDVPLDGAGIIVYGDSSTSHNKITIEGNYLEGTIRVYNLVEGKILGNHVDKAGYAGIECRGIKDSIIANNLVKNAGQLANATYDDGILLTDGTFTVTGSINNVITGNRCFDDQTSKTQDYGIKTAVNANYNIISQNIVLGNKTGGISAVGSNNQIRNNIGHVTENSGTGTIASGSTSVVITHGLSVTPTLDDITIIGGENPTNDVGTIWVDTIGATTFKVNVKNNPGASGFDFGWKAIVL